MLRVHCVQLFYNLSDPGMEDLLYESEPVRRFVGLKLSDPLPDYSEENQEQVADHFQVSYRTINTLVLNNVDIRDEDRVLLQ